MHDKCQKDYTRLCPSKAKKKKQGASTSTEQNVESGNTKGTPDELFSTVQGHIIEGAQCMSMATLTDIYVL